MPSARPPPAQREAALGSALEAAASHLPSRALEELGVLPGVDHLVIPLKKRGGDGDGQRESSGNCFFEVRLTLVAGASLSKENSVKAPSLHYFHSTNPDNFACILRHTVSCWKILNFSSE